MSADQRDPMENRSGHRLGMPICMTWTKYFPFLNLSYLICKVGIIPLTMQMGTRQLKPGPLAALYLLPIFYLLLSTERWTQTCVT